jgi:tRNA1(Val) A37 N6-methylase TrmN6
MAANYAAMSAERSTVSEDAILGGRLLLRQPKTGHRFGHDAILLAAATSGRAGECAVDLGAGVGAAGLALARRVEGLTVTLLEIDEALTDLARENAARNGLAERVHVLCLDVTAQAEAFAAARLHPGTADRVLINPPFNAGNNPSADHRRRLAHIAVPGMSWRWISTAAGFLRPQGVLTLIWRADGLGDVLAALDAAAFGAATLLPVHPKPDAAAIRVLIRAVKGSRAPLSLLPGFVLADAAGRPTAAAEDVLRNGAVLPLAAD